MMRWKLFSLLLVAALLAGCGGGGAGGAGQAGGDIQVQNAWVRAVSMGPMGGQPAGSATPGSGMSGGGMASEGLGNGAAYLLLVNNGSTPDRLLRVESDVAKAVELHISEMKNEVMTMRPVEAIDLPAGGQAELKPGGLHIMLVGLRRELKVGDQVTLRLVFEKASPLTVQAEVKMP